MSLRDALAAGSETDAPAWDREPTSSLSAAPAAAGTDYRTTTSTRLREPVAPPWVDDDPGTKSKKRKSSKADRPKRADKSAQKAAQKAERRRRLQDQLSISVPKAPPSATIVTAVGVAVAGLVLVAVIRWSFPAVRPIMCRPTTRSPRRPTPARSSIPPWRPRRSGSPRVRPTLSWTAACMTTEPMS